MDKRHILCLFGATALVVIYQEVNFQILKRKHNEVVDLLRKHMDEEFQKEVDVVFEGIVENYEDEGGD